MKLASLEFAAFAGLLLMLYYRIPGKQQWKLLLLAGGIFSLRAGWQHVLSLLVTSGSSFLAIRAMERNKAAFPKGEARKKNRILLALCLGLNFGLLLCCKASWISPLSPLPMGISFYTFQLMGYAIDVCRGTSVGEENFFRFHLFASWFPLLVQGPICRYDQLAPQLAAEHPYNRQQVSFGLQRMLWGYFKKLVVADRIAPVVAALTAMEDSSAAFFLLSLCYAIQIYGDFTGGMDVVLGLSQALGMELPENFHLPFAAKSVAEYWRRWHITLGEWMKRYVFYSVSLSKPVRTLGKWAKQRWNCRVEKISVSIAMAVTWLATGIWHGLTPNFILWGMVNCGVILLSLQIPARFALPRGKWFDRLRVTRTFLLMNLIRTLDLFPDPRDYFRAITARLNFAALGELSLSAADLAVLAGGIVLMAAVSRFQSRGRSVRRWLWRKPDWIRWSVLFGLLLLILLMGCYGPGYEASNFIYNQF